MDITMSVTSVTDGPEWPINLVGRYRVGAAGTEGVLSYSPILGKVSWNTVEMRVQITSAKSDDIVGVFFWRC